MATIPKEPTELERMTNAQRAVVDAFNVQVASEADLCIKRIREAFEAIVALPHKNEQGILVTHGCNMQMDWQVNYWTLRLNALETHMDRTKFAAMTGYKYTSDLVAECRNELNRKRTTGE